MRRSGGSARMRPADAVALAKVLDGDGGVRTHRLKAKSRKQKAEITSLETEIGKAESRNMRHKAESRKLKSILACALGSVDHRGHDCQEFVGLLFHWQSVGRSNPAILTQQFQP